MGWFVLGLFVGGFLGLLIGALACAAGKRDDPDFPHTPRRPDA